MSKIQITNIENEVTKKLAIEFTAPYTDRYMKNIKKTDRISFEPPSLVRPNN